MSERTSDWTATGIAAAVARGDRRARDVVAEAFDRIERLDGRVGAFRALRQAEALAEADALDGRDDLAALPLAGVPIAIKDNVAVAGMSLRDGTTATPSGPMGADHEVVRRLRAAGAVVVGVTNVPELSIWPMTDGPFGTARNPWDLSRTPGGSSGGSAAAVAAGMVPLALGNDGLGSIRIPAACCGLVGIKPGRGVVPTGLGHNGNTWFDMAENGPLATTAADAALGLAVMAGQDTLAAPTTATGVRVAVSTRSPVPGSRIDPQWPGALQRAADALRGCGHRVESADPAYPFAAVRGAATRWFAGAAKDLDHVRKADLQRRTRVHITIGQAAERLGLLRDSDVERWHERCRTFFSRYDVLATPTLSQRPPEAKEWHRRGWLANYWAASQYAPYPGPWNLAGYPAIAVPAGFDAGGLPLSVQLVAREGQEALLLSLAAQLEQAMPWRTTAPLGG